MARTNLDMFRARLGEDSRGCVIKNGYLIYQWGNIAINIDWASASKPCISTMLFVAVDEGRVESVDSPILPYWPGLRTNDQSMTFRHLANMMSGYACNDEDENDEPLPPGSRWAYNDYAINLYIKTMDKVFGTTDLLETVSYERLGQPLQFQDGVLFSFQQRRVKASVRDYARIGWFWLNRGGWNGTQVIPSHFFDDFMKAGVPLDTPSSTEFFPDDYLGVGSNGGGINQHDGQGIYGFNWWFNQSLTVPPRDPPLVAWPDAPLDTFLSSGHFGKRVLLVMPSLGMVVAAINTPAPTWGDTILTDPPDPDSTLNQNLKLLAEAVLPRFVKTEVAGQTLILEGHYGAPGSSYMIERADNAYPDPSDWLPVTTNQFDLYGQFSAVVAIEPGMDPTVYRLVIP